MLDKYKRNPSVPGVDVVRIEDVPENPQGQADYLKRKVSESRQLADWARSYTPSLPQSSPHNITPMAQPLRQQDLQNQGGLTPRLPMYKGQDTTQQEMINSREILNRYRPELHGYTAEEYPQEFSTGIQGTVNPEQMKESLGASSMEQLKFAKLGQMGLELTEREKIERWASLTEEERIRDLTVAYSIIPIQAGYAAYGLYSLAKPVVNYFQRAYDIGKAAEKGQALINSKVTEASRGITSQEAAMAYDLAVAETGGTPVKSITGPVVKPPVNTKTESLKTAGLFKTIDAFGAKHPTLLKGLAIMWIGGVLLEPLQLVSNLGQSRAYAENPRGDIGTTASIPGKAAYEAGDWDSAIHFNEIVEDVANMGFWRTIAQNVPHLGAGLSDAEKVAASYETTNYYADKAVRCKTIEEQAKSGYPVSEEDKAFYRQEHPFFVLSQQWAREDEEAKKLEEAAKYEPLLNRVNSGELEADDINEIEKLRAINPYHPVVQMYDRNRISVEYDMNQRANERRDTAEWERRNKLYQEQKEQESLQYAQSQATENVAREGEEQREEPSTLGFGLLGKSGSYEQNPEFKRLQSLVDTGQATDEDWAKYLWGVPYRVLNDAQKKVVELWKSK